MNPNEIDAGTLEVLPTSALESLERAQVDVQVSTAHKYPRSIEQFRRRAMDMVSQDIETAESCIYSRPVGGGKVVEGESIRMAEIVAACYGNLRFAAQIVEQTERYVKCEGVAHDLESNVAGKSQAMESTVKRDGTPYDERMRIVVAKACLSKALRDAIFRVVPKGLCKSISDSAKKVIAGQSKTLEQRRTAARQWLAQIKVDDARAFTVLNVKGWSEIGEEQLLILTGLKTALKDNEITLAEAFPQSTAANTGPGPVPQKQHEPTQTAAPAKAVAEAKAVTAPPPAAKQETKPTDDGADTDLAPQPAKTEEKAPAPLTCRYCKSVVPPGEMESHNCAEMQAALAKRQQDTAKKATPPPAADPSSPTDYLASLNTLMEQASVTEDELLGWCHANKMAKPEITKLSQLAESKLQKMNTAWTAIITELKKAKAATPAA